jgi:hypothetical protein
MHTLPYQINCTHCGCADVAVERPPVPGHWALATGRGRCNCCQSVFSFKEPEDGPEDGQGLDNDLADLSGLGGDQGRNGVIFQPVRCPSCRSQDVPVQHTRLPVRYHRCRSCGETFKSVEK